MCPFYLNSLMLHFIMCYLNYISSQWVCYRYELPDG
jgi:hypothetical protein